MTSTLSDNEKIAVFHKIAQAWETKQWRTCVELMTPDVVLHSMMLQPTNGREVIYQRLVKMSPPNKQCKLHIDRVGVIDGAVVVERRDEVIVDDVSRFVPVVGILSFEGLLVSQWREYYDRATLVAAQGSTSLEAQAEAEARAKTKQ